MTSQQHNAPGNLVDVLRRAQEKHPDRTAVVFGSKEINYADLFKESCRVASALRAAGAKQGEKIAILLDNSPEFITAYFGILLNRNIVVPINHMFKREEIKYILDDSEATGLITSAAYACMADELSAMTDKLAFVLQASWIRDQPLEKENFHHPQKDASGPNELAVFLYTSGTTGHPKAAMLTHGNLLSNVRSSSQCIRVSPKDTFICFLPLFHSFAATVCMLMPLVAGAKTVIMKSPRPIKKLLRTIRKHRVTIFVGIPSIYGILKDTKLPRFLPPVLLRLLNPIRLAISGAAALPVEVFLGFEKKFRMPLLEGYGLTEASPVVSLNPLRGPRKPGSIGLPLPDVRVKIVNDRGDALGPEQEGELCVKGPNVMLGYYKKEEDNGQALKDGWLLTGDMARIDRDGYIVIMGRKKDMVNVRGLNVYPREIEEVLYRHPAIREAAVIGVPDPHKGEVPKGYVVLKKEGSLTSHDIIVYLRPHLADYKIPRKIEIRNELPKNSSGKILKRILIEESSSQDASANGLPRKDR
ncbi:MAG: long-chain fatty acid--CoA ligase [Candidatus Omnitrophica bacterium]|nr:long-chain fatty acid--CoA ligase [Candidatus Omnitrophota bacterium]